MNFKEHGVRYIFLTLLVFNIGLWHMILSANGGILTVAFLDVGQGDAVFIEAPNGNQILLDGGNGKHVLRELSRVMPFYDRSIDVVIASHPDQDHIGGLTDILARFSVGVVMQTENTSESAVYRLLNETIDASGAQQIIARRGQRIILGGGVVLEILFPDRDTSDWGSNDASIIARLVYGETSFMLTGDSPIKMENYLTSLDGERLHSTVLKLGHHGSKTSSSATFLSAVSPQLAIVSAGKDNRYGHPHTEVMERVKDFDITPLATFERGTIVLESDGVRVVVK